MWQKTRIAMALLLAGASIQPVLALEPSVATVTRKLLWSQEFNGKANTAPNPKVFTYDLGDGGGWGNSEQQYYTKQRQNVRIDGQGNLVISAVRIPDPLYFDPCITCSFTSARLKTQDRIGFRYGRIEARI